VPNEDKRCEPRQPVQLEALMSPRGAFRAQIVTLRNVSANGAMGEAAKPPAVGEAVTLKVGATTTIVAVVVWRVQERFGLKFDREVDPLEYAEF
jgi:hypothetical protein